MKEMFFGYQLNKKKRSFIINQGQAFDEITASLSRLQTQISWKAWPGLIIKLLFLTRLVAKEHFFECLC